MRNLLILVTFLVSPFWVSAQLTDTSLPQIDALEVSPSYPGPDETVTVKLNDYRSALFGASINWYVNDVLVKEVANRREITITSGLVGTQTIIEAVLNLTDGTRENIRTVIKPVYLDLIIEPQTHVPDFYSGRALPSIGSMINVTALLGGSAISQNNLIYTWRINQTTLEGGPIKGGSKISFPTPLGQTTTLSLEVATQNGEVLAQRAVFLPSVRPEVHFYEVNSLYGVSDKAIATKFNFIANSATLRAEPYYLDSRVFNNPSALIWEIDGTPISNTDDNPYNITFQKTTNSGESQIDFLVRSTTELLQIGRASIDINY